MVGLTELHTIYLAVVKTLQMNFLGHLAIFYLHFLQIYEFLCLRISSGAVIAADIRDSLNLG